MLSLRIRIPILAGYFVAMLYALYIGWSVPTGSRIAPSIHVLIVLILSLCIFFGNIVVIQAFVSNRKLHLHAMNALSLGMAPLFTLALYLIASFRDVTIIG